MSYKQIGDYGVIGDGITLALVGRDGAVDWMCLPRMNSPSVFGALLDDARGGRFAIGPEGHFDSAHSYLPRTNVLRTRFRTASGEVELTDLMVAHEDRADDAPVLLRRLEGIRGRVPMAVECTPRFDYARLVPERERSAGGLRFRAGDERLVLRTSRVLDWQGPSARLVLEPQEVVWFALGGEEPALPARPEQCEALLDATCRYWERWVRQGETGLSQPDPHWQPQLERSALVLKLLQLRRTGAIAAAGTTSLPAIVHGERNWDYRLSWIRDTSMTLSALYELGHVAETERYLEWLGEVTRHGERGRLCIVYQLHEPSPPGDETELAHLAGYKGSRPVRVGQYVVRQRQHDIYGELLDALFAVSRLAGKIRFEHWALLSPLVEEVMRIWREPDDGIWEARIGARHYVHSKLMCWVALDRAIKIASHYGFPADLDAWRREREAIRADILERGYREDRGCFTQHYETDAVDAALLLIPLSGLLPIDDPRVAGTIAVIERELLVDRTLLRYRLDHGLDDGLEGQEQGFLICLYWYLQCLILQGRLDEVDGYLRDAGRYRNALGLFGEQYDPRLQQITGNYPQAYSHIGFATTALRYLEARRARPQPRPVPLRRKLALLAGGAVLNEAQGADRGAEADPGAAMKRAMNAVRARFYDGHSQRIDYAAIRGAAQYRAFQGLAAQLQDFDPDTLDTDAQRIAFWVNVFNTLVIHGVVELGIRDSVKEVPLFFECIRYRVGAQTFTAADIEHGILRGNAVPPYRLRRRLRGRDPRRRHAVREVDPRIHFALVCASRTCPPIEAYDADALDGQLDASARTFINATSRLEGDRLHLSELFRWYRADFGGTPQAIARSVARHLYDRDAAARIEADAARLRLVYTPYDWRLNR